MSNQIIEIADSNGNIVAKVDATCFPLFVTTDTITTTAKKYILSVNYLKDPATKEKDKTKITGMQLS